MLYDRTVVCPICPVCLPVTLVYCGQTVGWIRMPLGTEVGLGPGHIVLDTDLAILPKRDTVAPHFSAHVYCGQTAEWINMPLGTEVCLVPGHIVLDWNPAPPHKGAQQAPNFRPMSIVAKQLDGSRCQLVWR